MTVPFNQVFYLLNTTLDLFMLYSTIDLLKAPLFYTKFSRLSDLVKKHSGIIKYEPTISIFLFLTICVDLSNGYLWSKNQLATIVCQWSLFISSILYVSKSYINPSLETYPRIKDETK